MTHSDVGLQLERRELEKQELGAVLGSGILDRAPNLEHLLTYVCHKYFEGAATEIKEYSIAVDALGRSADFDQKRDSIVRVEAHRLRKRLREYYETEGASHAIRIEIPCGQYAPRFVSCSPAVAEPAQVLPAPEVASATEAIASAEEAPPQAASPAAAAPVSEPPALELPVLEQAEKSAGATRRLGTISRAAIIALALCAGAAAIYYSRPLIWSRSALAGVPPVATPLPGTQAVRILAGLEEGKYIDRSGREWSSDRYFQGGSVFDCGDRPIFGTREPRLYQTRREGNFTYDIPLSPGVYELRLYFAETLYGENNAAGGGETSRIFDIYINGMPALQGFDVIGEVGPTTADIRAFKDVEPASDGELHLRFEKATNPAFINAIEINPGIPGKLRPIRIVSRDHAYTDKEGRTWEPDRYAHGGQLVIRTQPIEAAKDPELFHGERFGNLRYMIPVPPGRYGVTFYFAESWFGPAMPAGGGDGSRVFDILANGIALRRNFDIYKEAGGTHRAVSFTSHGLEPDAQGKLEIALHPVHNYACVSAIEVVDESVPGEPGR